MADTPIISPWIQYRQYKLKARIRLFCLPHAGSGASLFRTWPENVPPEIEICPIQLPGRENRLSDAPFSCMSQLIAPLAQALFPYLDMPYALFGHSMGSLICFDLARYLRHVGHDQAPIHLFVSGHRAPQLPDPDPPIHALPAPEFVKELRRLKGTPEEVLQHEELLQLLIPLLKADFSLCETYVYKHERSLDCPITAFGGLQDEEVSREALASWSQQTSASFSIRFFVGNHFFIYQEQAALLQAITQALFSKLE